MRGKLPPLSSSIWLLKSQSHIYKLNLVFEEMCRIRGDKNMNSKNVIFSKTASPVIPG